jgi:hypothetical protein
MSQAAQRRNRQKRSPTNMRSGKQGGGGGNALAAQDDAGNTPLHLACRAPQVDSVLKALLEEYGPGVNEWVETPNAEGRSALHMLCAESIQCAEEMHSGEVRSALHKPKIGSRTRTHY